MTILWMLAVFVAWAVSLVVVGRVMYLRGSENEVERYLQAIRRASLTGSSARRVTSVEETP